MRLTGTILTIAFFALTLCGAGVLAVHTDNGAHVSGCPFAGTMDASCPLFTVNHLGNFASILGSLPVSPFAISLLLACLAAASAAVIIVPTMSRRIPHPSRVDDSAVWHPLQLAFSRGILNPKVY